MARRQKETTGRHGRRIRGVTFDAGHTLLFPEPSLGVLYADTAARHGMALSAAEAETRFRDAWVRQRRQHSGLVYGTDHAEARGFWLKVVADIFDEPRPPAPRLGRFLDDLYEVFARPASWRLNAAWHEVRRHLLLRGVRIGLVSNWDLRLRGMLEGMGLASQFEAIAISAELAIEKPSPGIFRHVTDRLGVAPGDCLHVGDTWQEDIVGAVAAGLRPVWFNPAGQALPAAAVACHSVRTLDELLALV